MQQEENAFTFRVTDGWLRDLASEPTPHDPWPCIRWDDQLLADQIRSLEVQAELGVIDGTLRDIESLARSAAPLDRVRGPE